MALGSTQPLTQMSTRYLPLGKGRPARKADNLAASTKYMQHPATLCRCCTEMAKS
jgi:hypothetical protein